MKRRLFTFALAALTIVLLGSCSKINERIDGLDQRVGNIENEKIASIENQIAAINSSIADLGTIRKDITDLQAAVGAKGEDISELKAADEALGQRIDELKAYVGDLSKYAEKDWVTATFATLEKLNETNTALGALEEKVNKLGETTDAKIAGLKTELTNAIDSAISGINATISTLEGRVAALEAMIQSVKITPAYSDGSVEAENGILTLKCIVSPAEALIGMESLKDSLLIYADSVKVKTKATTPAYMTIEVSEASVLDAAQGAITLTADISEYLPKGEDKALTVAVNIKNGISDFTTEFVPVTLAAPAPLPAGALKGVFSVSATKKVRFSQGNLYWDGDSFELETNQYDVQSSWSTSHVSHFFWSKDASVAYAASYSESGTAVTDVFFTNDPTDAEKAKADFTVNGVTGEYRTLSKDEFNYLFSRTSKHGYATVGGVWGIIILPDTFTDPMKNGGSGAFKPLPTQGYDANVYTIGGNWEAMESAGAVFLPTTNFRKGTNFDQYSSGSGRYWSSIVRNASRVYGVTFNEGIVYPKDSDHERNYGRSVRLVTDVK